jgi:hypothetical protein
VNQDSLDRWLPTLTRYLGFLMAVVLFVFLTLGHWEALPGFVPAAGLLAYGSVRNAARQNGHA